MRKLALGLCVALLFFCSNNTSFASSTENENLNARIKLLQERLKEFQNREYKDAEEKLKFFIERFEKRYVDLGKGKYFLGDEFTLADIFLATVIPSVFDVMELKENYYKTIAPNLGKLIKRVKENELKEFYEKYYV